MLSAESEYCRGYVVNLAFVGFCFYAVYYTLLEPFAGLTWTFISGVPAMWTYNMLQQHAYSYAWAIGLGAHVLGWFMQVGVVITCEILQHPSVQSQAPMRIHVSCSKVAAQPLDSAPINASGLS